MAAKSRANLKAAFQTGDKPDGDDFSDLIDSFVTLTDASSQTLASPIDSPTATIGTVSASTLYANTIYGAGLSTHQNPYIEAFTEATALTSVETTAVWTVVSAELTAPNKSAFSVSGHDVTYTGSVTAKCMVVASLAVKNSANTNCWFAIFKNDALVSGSIAQTRLPAVAVQHYDIRSVVELKGNDVVNIRAQMPDGPIFTPQTFSVGYFIMPIYWR